MKLSSVLSDLLGVSRQRIIQAMIAGEESPELLSWKLRGKLRKKGKLVKESLKGCFNDFHRMLLKGHYELFEFLSQQVQDLEAEIQRRMEPYAEQVEGLMTIPGVDRMVAWSLIAELGVDMSVFPSARHCASWGESVRASAKARASSSAGARRRGIGICGGR